MDTCLSLPLIKVVFFLPSTWSYSYASLTPSTPIYWALHFELKECDAIIHPSAGSCNFQHHSSNIIIHVVTLWKAQKGTMYRRSRHSIVSTDFLALKLDHRFTSDNACGPFAKSRYVQSLWNVQPLSSQYFGNWIQIKLTWQKVFLVVSKAISGDYWCVWEACGAVTPAWTLVSVHCLFTLFTSVCLSMTKDRSSLLMNSVFAYK